MTEEGKKNQIMVGILRPCSLTNSDHRLSRLLIKKPRQSRSTSPKYHCKTRCMLRTSFRSRTPVRVRTLETSHGFIGNKKKNYPTHLILWNGCEALTLPIICLSLFPSNINVTWTNLYLHIPLIISNMKLQITRQQYYLKLTWCLYLIPHWYKWIVSSRICRPYSWRRDNKESLSSLETGFILLLIEWNCDLIRKLHQLLSMQYGSFNPTKEKDYLRNYTDYGQDPI